jgi:hypothetical protein
LRSHTHAEPDDLGVGDVLLVLGGCARAHPPDVAPELVSELKTRKRAFICNCSRCSLGTLRLGSYCRRGDRGRSYGRGHLGRRDGRDHSTMTARRLCKSVLYRNRGIARVGGCFAEARARAGESLADTAGSAS